MDSVESLLGRIGLSPKEARVYLAVLRFGMQPASVIARKTGLPRVTVYVMLRELVSRGLAHSLIRGRVQFFSVLSPAELSDHAHRKAEEWKGIGQETLRLLPEFLQLGSGSLNRPQVRFYEGLEGIKEVYNDTLSHGADILGFLTVERIPEELKHYFLEHYLPMALKKGVHARFVLTDSKKSRAYQRYDAKCHRSTYLLPASMMPFETEIALYGEDRVAAISFAKNDLHAVIIESREIHNTLKSVYLFCEGMAKKLKE